MDPTHIQASHSPQAQTKVVVVSESPRFSLVRLIRTLVALPVFLCAVTATLLIAFAWLLPQRLEEDSQPYITYVKYAFYLRVFQLHLAGLLLLATFVLLLCGWKRSALLSVLVAIAAASPFVVHLFQPAPAATGTPLRVMAANLWVQNKGGPELVAEIRRVDPDVLIIQELTATQWQLIRDNFGGIYKYSDLPRLNGVAAMWSKYPLKPDPATIVTKFGAFRAAELDWNGTPVALYGVHLVSPSGDWSIARNRQQIAQLIRQIEGEKRPLIIAGDFNAPALSAQLIALSRANLKDAFASVSKEWLGLSWRPRDGPLSPLGFLIGARIDHVFYSPQFKATKYETGNDIGSDHLPIVVELELVK